MTHNEMIAVIAAHRDGKKIEYRNGRDNGNRWMVIESVPLWNFGDGEYRIKPEPRECWVKFDSRGSVLHAHKDGHDEGPNSECGGGECGYVLMREVMP